MFKHGIRGDRLRIPDGMPDSTDPLASEFFANLGCPLVSTPIEAEATEVHMVETRRIRWRASLQRSRANSFPYINFGLFLGDFCKGCRFATRMTLFLITLGAL